MHLFSLKDLRADERPNTKLHLMAKTMKTNRQTDEHRNLETESAQWADSVKMAKTDQSN